MAVYQGLQIDVQGRLGCSKNPGGAFADPGSTEFDRMFTVGERFHPFDSGSDIGVCKNSS